MSTNAAVVSLVAETANNGIYSAPSVTMIAEELKAEVQQLDLREEALGKRETELQKREERLARSDKGGMEKALNDKDQTIAGLEEALIDVKELAAAFRYEFHDVLKKKSAAQLGISAAPVVAKASFRGRGRGGQRGWRGGRARGSYAGKRTDGGDSEHREGAKPGKGQGFGGRGLEGGRGRGGGRGGGRGTFGC
ncbi:hypothetical protein LTR65_009006 [Meristemomyces frigidus]